MRIIKITALEGFLRHQLTQAICVLAFSLSMVPIVTAQVVLFPGTSSAVVDNGFGDSNILPGHITVTNVPIPNSNGSLQFSGDVNTIITGAGGVSGTGLFAQLQITNATIDNISGLPASIGGIPTVFANYNHIVPSGLFGVVTADLNGSLDNPGSGNALGQNIDLEVRHSNFFPFDGDATDQGRPVLVDSSTSLTAANAFVNGFTSVGIMDSASSVQGDFADGLGQLRITLTSLDLEAGDLIILPSSIEASVISVPEPSSCLILLSSLGATLVGTRRRIFFD